MPLTCPLCRESASLYEVKATGPLDSQHNHPFFYPFHPRDLERGPKRPVEFVDGPPPALAGGSPGNRLPDPGAAYRSHAHHRRRKCLGNAGVGGAQECQRVVDLELPARPANTARPTAEPVVESRRAQTVDGVAEGVVPELVAVGGFEIDFEFVDLPAGLESGDLQFDDVGGG